MSGVNSNQQIEQTPERTLPIRSRRGSSSKKLKQPFKSPFRQTAAEARDDKEELDALRERSEELDRDIHQLQSQGHEESELDVHIHKLHQYNDMKDIAQMLLGKIAEHRGVTTRDLYQCYDLHADD